MVEMNEEKLPRYVKIAHDICGRILTGEFPEGTILKGRSMLASVYNVSPETIRKAINILAEEKIIEVKHGVGIFVYCFYSHTFASRARKNLRVYNINLYVLRGSARNVPPCIVIMQMNDVS